MKFFKIFYKKGNNRYYTLSADGEIFIATETFIKITKSLRVFNREIIQGLKLLKITAPILILLDYINDNVKALKKQKYDTEELIQYNQITSKEVKDVIKEYYNTQEELEKIEIDSWLEKVMEAVKEISDEKEQEIAIKQFTERAKKMNEMSKEYNAVKNHIIDLRIPKGISTINGLIKDGASHLYSEAITSFMTNHYLFNLDIFGKLTIYRIITVKDVIQSIDTTIIDKEIIEKFLNHLEKEGGK